MHGNVASSKQISWEGGIAGAHSIVSVTGAAEVRTRSLELHFSWNLGRAEADAVSARREYAYRNRPRYGLILPPDTGVEFRITEKSNYKFLAIEFEPHYVWRAAELQHLCDVEAIETWDYDHPLTWHLAQAIHQECETEARQGMLYAETAIAFLALHVVRCLSNVTRELRIRRRGGLAPVTLQRACEYMVSRMGEDVSLSEVARVSSLSLGHFSSAFKQSTGLAPHAWLRRQRVDRAKTLLRERALSLEMIARAVGFANQSAFGVAFRKETRWSPAAWRRQHEG